jgi:ATP-dependent DNA helicase RecG
MSVDKGRRPPGLGSPFDLRSMRSAHLSPADMNQRVDRLIALIDEFAAAGHETRCVEFKVDNWDPERIGTLVSAISNAARIADEACGYIIWGVADDTHKIVGTEFRPSREKHGNQPLELWLATAISPSLDCVFREVAHPKGRVVLLEIPAAMQVPTRFKNIAYVRIGPTTPKLGDHRAQEESLVAKLRPFIWEQGVAKTFMTARQVVELLDVVAYFGRTEQPFPGDDDGICAVLCHDRLISEDAGGRWNILNLGAILFARDLSNFEGVARKAVRVIAYEDRTRLKGANERLATKGYAVDFEAMIAHINGHLPKREQLTKPLRENVPVYPEIAVRELVANALLHQDMTITGTSPVVEIFADRIEITNPGAPLLETNRFIDLPPRSRNEALAALMRRMGVCEERGSGVDKAIFAIEEARLPPPDFRALPESTRAIIYGPKRFADLTSEERARGCYQHAVLRYIHHEGGITNTTLRMRFGVAERNASQISRVIKQTVTIGLIKASDNWTARAGHYLPYWA